MSGILVAAALLPAVVLMVYVYRKDTVEKEPTRLIVRVFLLGVAAGPVAAIIENIAFGLFESIVSPGALLLVLEYFVGVAAVEEGCKYAALSTIRKNTEFNYVFDGIVYGVAAALGFAALENLLYVFDGGLEVAVVRAIFSVPGHCADGVVMGCFFGLARRYEVTGDGARARTNYFLAFLLPTIEHGFYDCALSTESDLMMLVALASQIVFIVFAMVLVNRMSKNDAPIGANQSVQPAVQQQPYPQPAQVQQPYSQAVQVQQPYPQPVQVQTGWTCSRCGNSNTGKFCGECGMPRQL